MHVSEIFLSFVRRLIFSFCLVLLVAVASHAQGNAGTVGVATTEVTVFSGQASAASSGGIWGCYNAQTGTTPSPCPILPDRGFASHDLFVCNSGFSGTIDLEWSPTYSASNPTATFYPLVTGTYSNDSACHSLQVGLYFPNMRSTVTWIFGSTSAWYTASAAPIPNTPAALGSNGPTSPIQCDTTKSGSGASGTQTALFTTSATRGLGVCSFTISFGGATSTSATGVQIGYGATCSGGVYPWTLATTASTPQTIVVGSGLGAVLQVPFGTTNLCVNNNSGATVTVAASYALQ
jgi:hypothetical protein